VSNTSKQDFLVYCCSRLALHPQAADYPQHQKKADAEPGAKQQKPGQTIAISPNAEGNGEDLEIGIAVPAIVATLQLGAQPEEELIQGPPAMRPVYSGRFAVGTGRC
jgi:hypothetical protein